MAFSFTKLLDVLLLRQRPFLLYAITWTGLVMMTVAAASFLPEMAFSWAVQPSSSFSHGACDSLSMRVPMDGPPGVVICLPAQIFGRSKLDLLVPPVFAAFMVAGSACFVRAIGLCEWESEEDMDTN